MIFLDVNDLRWQPYVTSWISNIKDEILRENLNDLFNKWLPRILKFKQSFCKDLIPVSETASVISLCKLLDSLQKQEANLSFENAKKDEVYYTMLEKWFAFSLIWSVGASVNEEGRNLFDSQMRDIESMFPNSLTVYDYFINTEKLEWGLWDEKIGVAWKPPANQQFHKMFVPTADTARNRFVIQAYMRQKYHVMAVGTTGTGKTALLNGIL